MTNFYTYTGREYDAHSSLYYYRARYYDSTTGRFLSEDPMGFLGGINLWISLWNNPLNWIDPWGLRPLTKQERHRLLQTAQNWVGTPYAGDDSEFKGGSAQKQRGADCSGAVWGIYNEAGFPYEYLNSKSFPESQAFKPLGKSDQPQPGDIGRWEGHMVIYAPNYAIGKNALGARNPKRPFSAVKYQWYDKPGNTVQWYSYDVPENNLKKGTSCP